MAGLTFSINEVQAAQRFFNESEFAKKIAEISKSIGKPKANVSRTASGRARGGHHRVLGHRLVPVPGGPPQGAARRAKSAWSWTARAWTWTSWSPASRDKNATINDDGRLDASELEVRLLSDPDALITEMEVPMPSPETRLADDATEEIWDQQSAPEFRWD